MLDSECVCLIFSLLLINSQKLKTLAIIELAAMIMNSDIPEKSSFKTYYVFWN